MNTKPSIRVSVAMAVYNGEAYLSEQIDSILCQMTGWDELVISVDPSTDASKEIVLKYAAKDSRVRLADGPGRGIIANFTNALALAVGEYIFLSDQDDIWERHKIANTLERMTDMEAQAGPEEPLLIFTDLQVVEANMKPVAVSFMHFSKLDGRRTALHQLLIQNVVTGCTVLINGSLKKLALEHITDDRVLMHDWWFAIVASAMGTISYIDEQTVMYRQHGGNIIGAKNTRSIGYIFRKMLANYELKKSIMKTTQQAQLLFENFGERLSPDTQRLVKGYAELYTKGKLRRLVFMFRHRTLKYGLMRKLAQIIWG